MSNLFDTLSREAFRAGVTPKTDESRKWFRQRAKDLRGINRKELQRELPTGGDIIGTMQMFFYDPKTKDTLPYYDKFPLVVVVGPAKGGFYGLNFHYLPMGQRVLFLRQLAKYASDKNFDRNTRYNLTGGIENNRYFKLCIKHYLWNHVRSSFLNIHPDEMAIGIFLPVARFRGGSFGNI